MRKRIGFYNVVFSIFLMLSCDSISEESNLTYKSDIPMLIKRMMYGMKKPKSNVYIFEYMTNNGYVSKTFKEKSQFSKDSTYSYCYKRLSENLGRNDMIKLTDFKEVFPGAIKVGKLDSVVMEGITDGLIIYFSKVALNEQSNFGISFCDFSIVENNILIKKRLFKVFHKKTNGDWKIDGVSLFGVLGEDFPDLPNIGNAQNDKDWQTGEIIK